MAEVTIREKVWEEFVTLARRLRRKPESLAESVLRDYIQRIDDEKLLADSRRDARRAFMTDEELFDATARAARGAKFRIEDTEELIRQLRREKARKAANGRSQEADSRGD